MIVLTWPFIEPGASIFLSYTIFLNPGFTNFGNTITPPNNIQWQYHSLSPSIDTTACAYANDKVSSYTTSPPPYSIEQRMDSFVEGTACLTDSNPVANHYAIGVAIPFTITVDLSGGQTNNGVLTITAPSTFTLFDGSVSAVGGNIYACASPTPTPLTSSNFALGVSSSAGMTFTLPTQICGSATSNTAADQVVFTFKGAFNPTAVQSNTASLTTHIDYSTQNINERHTTNLLTSATYTAEEATLSYQGPMTVSPTSGQLMSVITYTMQVCNSAGNTKAYNVHVTNVFEDGITNSPAAATSSSNFAMTATKTNSKTWDFVLAELSPSQCWQITFQGVLTNPLYAGDTLSSTATTTWRSSSCALSQTLYKTSTVSTPTSSLVGYVNVLMPSFVVSNPVGCADGAGTGHSDYFVPGETFTIDAAMTIQDVTICNAVVVLNFPTGVQVTAGHVIVNSNTLNASDATTTKTISPDGTKITFNFTVIGNAGDGMTDSNDVITVRADATILASNTVQNVNGASNVIVGTFSYDSACTTPVTLSSTSQATQPTLNIKEPHLSIVTSTAQREGDWINYVLEFTNDLTSSAYDVHVVRTIDSSCFELVTDSSNNPQVTITQTATPPSSDNVNAGPNMDITVNHIAPGESVTVTYSVKLADSVPFGTLLASCSTNDVKFDYYSLGVDTDNCHLEDSPARHYNPPPTNSPQFQVTKRLPALDVVSSCDASSTDPVLNVGEVVTLYVDVDLSNGITYADPVSGTTTLTITVTDTNYFKILTSTVEDPGNWDVYDYTGATKGARLTAASFGTPVFTPAPTSPPPTTSATLITWTFPSAILGDTNGPSIVTFQFTGSFTRDTVPGETANFEAELLYQHKELDNRITLPDDLSVVVPRLSYSGYTITPPPNTPAPGCGQLGDVYTVSFAITNSGTGSAYNLVSTLTNSLGMNNNYGTTTSSITTGFSDTQNSATEREFKLNELPISSTWTVTFQVQLETTLYLSDTLTLHGENRYLTSSCSSFPDPYEDTNSDFDGTICTKDPQIVLNDPTSCSDGGGYNDYSPPDVLIGDTVTFGSSVTFYEGISCNTVVTLTLPTGLTATSASYSLAPGSALTFSSTPTYVISGGGSLITYTFYDVTDAENNADNAQDVLTISFQALVANVASNYDGVTLQTSATLAYNPACSVPDRKTIPAANEPEVTIIEPDIVMSESVYRDDDYLYYSLVITNDGTADAFVVDVVRNIGSQPYFELQLAAPYQMTFTQSAPSPPNYAGSASGSTSTTTQLHVTVPYIPIGESLTVSYVVKIIPGAPYSSTLPPDQITANYKSMGTAGTPACDVTNARTYPPETIDSAPFQVTKRFVSLTVQESCLAETNGVKFFSIGEIINFRILANMSDGRTTNGRITVTTPTSGFLLFDAKVLDNEIGPGITYNGAPVTGSQFTVTVTPSPVTPGALETITITFPTPMDGAYPPPDGTLIVHVFGMFDSTAYSGELATVLASLHMNSQTLATDLQLGGKRKKKKKKNLWKNWQNNFDNFVFFFSCL